MIITKEFYDMCNIGITHQTIPGREIPFDEVPYWDEQSNTIVHPRRKDEQRGFFRA